MLGPTKQRELAATYSCEFVSIGGLIFEDSPRTRRQNELLATAFLASPQHRFRKTRLTVFQLGGFQESQQLPESAQIRLHQFPRDLILFRFVPLRTRWRRL